MFRGYYQPTKEDIETMWQEGLISLDANVLLSLYNVLPTTSSLYLAAMTKRKPQMWIPYQVALEFHRNVHKERARQTTAHQNRIKQIEGLLGELRSTARKSRFQASDTQDRAVESLNALKDELAAQRDSIAKQTSHHTPDALLERISGLFAGQVGIEPDQTTLDAMFKDGENRYSAEIPPGFEDAKTKTGNRKYGDYVLWRQLMDHAASEKRDLIFVTDDDKADWWLKIEKTSVAPRPELIQEFRAETGQDILILKSSQFYQQLVPATGDAAHSEEVIAAQEDMEAAVSESKDIMALMQALKESLENRAPDATPQPASNKRWSPYDRPGRQLTIDEFTGDSPMLSALRAERAQVADEVDFLSHRRNELEHLQHTLASNSSEAEAMLREQAETYSRLDMAIERMRILDSRLHAFRHGYPEPHPYG